MSKRSREEEGEENGYPTKRGGFIVTDLNSEEKSGETGENGKAVVFSKFSTFSEVKEAFEQFIENVPPEMIPKLHKLVREAEEADEEERSGDGKLGDGEEAEEAEGGEGSRKILPGDDLIYHVVDDLRGKVPVNAIAPDEKIYINSSEENGYTKENVINVDSFLYDDDDVDELCDKALIQRNYCKDCHSRNIEPLIFVSHSCSVSELQFIFKECLKDKINGKVFLDLGSRMGGVLYSAYLYTNAKKIIGIEKNSYFCNIQNDIVKKYNFGDRIQVIEADLFTKPEVLQTSDCILMHSIFEFFAPIEDHEKNWRFLLDTIMPGTLIVATPSLEDQFQASKVSFSVDKWVKKLPIRYPKGRYTKEEIEDLKSYHLYQVHQKK